MKFKSQFPPTDPVKEFPGPIETQDESAASPSPVSRFRPQGWFPFRVCSGAGTSSSWRLIFSSSPSSCYVPKNLGLKTLWDAKGLDQSWADPSFQPRTLTTVEQPCANSSWRVRVWEARIGLFLKVVLLIF